MRRADQSTAHVPSRTIGVPLAHQRLGFLIWGLEVNLAGKSRSPGEVGTGLQPGLRHVPVGTVPHPMTALGSPCAIHISLAMPGRQPFGPALGPDY